MTDLSTKAFPPGKAKLTYQDYLRLPDDGKQHEIIDGELYVTAAPVPRHQRVSKRILRVLVGRLEDKGLGEVFFSPIDLVLDDFNVVQPDLLFVREKRLEIIGEKYVEGPPDLVIEILSPSTRRKDLLIKSRLYARFGVPAYWIVDPEACSVETFRLNGDAYESEGKTFSPEALEPAEFPGLRLDLAGIFGEP